MKIALGAIAGFAMLVGAVAALPHRTRAATANVTGWAWSSTVGWISLNCLTGSSTAASVCSSTVDYGVNIDPSSGNFSGHAWSSAIGWISFQSADVTAQCGPVARLDATTRKVTGWARMISGTVASGADGCISMSGFGPDYGVFYNPAATPNNILGDAWGSTVIGWIRFYGILSSAPSVDLKINGGDYPSTAPLMMPSSGGAASLSWTSNNVSACTATASSGITDWSGSKSPTGATFGVTVPANGTTSPIVRTYTISCTPIGGGTAVTDTVYVNVASTNAPLLQLLVDGVTSKNVDAGTAVTLTWTTQNIVNTPTCVGTSSPTFSGWNGSKASSPTSTPITYSYIATITAPVDFTINSCSSSVGGTVAPVTVHVGINAPSCSIEPSTWVVAAPAGSSTFSATQNFGTVWGHTSYRTSTVSKSSLSGVTASFGPSSLCPGVASGTSSASLNGTNTCAALSISGTSPTTARTMTLTAAPGSGSPVSSCAPATVTIMPAGSCTDPSATNYGAIGPCTYLPGTGPRTGPRKAPWIEI